jgi:hypothetical protein
MTLLRNASRWLGKTLQVAAAETIIYRRGDDDADLTKAIPGRNVHALHDIEGEQQSEIEYDWMIAANELIIGSLKVEPEKGDRIIWNRPDGQTATYTVLPDASDRCYRDVDQFGILYRVHCKLTNLVTIAP